MKSNLKRSTLVSLDTFQTVPTHTCPVTTVWDGQRKQNVFIVGSCSREQPRGPFKNGNCHPTLCFRCLTAPRECV